ncbi:MAG: helix-turn-helix domain-containing protein [Patescibacteria group bacterium]
MEVIKKLQQIGLSEKEARVYASLLECGEATAQELTIRSGLNRATTYIILDNLLKQGLLSRFSKKKKMLFSLESPKQILDLLEKRKEDVEFKIKLVKEMLPELEMFQKVTGEKAKVRFFEGKEGVKMIQQDILNSKPKSTEEMYNINVALKNFPVSPKDHRQIYKKIQIRDRSIAVYDPKESIPHLPLSPKEERRYLPQNKNRFNAEFVLYNNKAAILSVKGEWMGVIIENQAIADGLRFLFDLAWLGAEKYKVLKDKK